MTKGAFEDKFILWLEDSGKDKSEIVGGKAAGLGEMIKAGIPVPPGFVLTSEAYRYFVEETGIKSFIYHILDEVIVSGSPQEYEKASELIRSKFIRTPMPHRLKEMLIEAYRELGRKIGVENPRVAVRSSATLEDLPEASFAGQQDTYLNVQGVEDLIEYVKRVWASLWTARALSYRDSLNIEHESALMAVIVQKMVNSKVSGVLFTVHPVTGEKDKIVIEGAWGLGEYVVEGKVTPDQYIIDKNTLNVVERRIAKKTKALFYDPLKGMNVEIKVPESPEDLKSIKEYYPEIARILEEHNIWADAPCLSEEELRTLGELAKRAENYFGTYIDMEWAIDADIKGKEGIFITQARPVTVIGGPKEEVAEKEEAVKVGKVLVKGIPASPGIASGKVKVVLNVEEAAKKMERGDILVTKMTDPDWVPYMKMASAIVTDEGGLTAHAAIVARELGIPAIVGAGNATKILKDGMTVTVDGSKGVVLYGKIEEVEEKPKAEKAVVAPMAPPEILVNIYPPTATKIYMNLGHPDEIDRYKHLPFDGIGLMRIEFIISSWIKYHPMYLIEQGRGVFFVDKLAEGIAKVASAIYPRPVVVRFSDFKSNEYRRLKGGEKYEILEERNPMIGWRGVSRYIHPNYEPAFRLELRAIKKVREEWGLKNVWVMLPFVRTTWELKKALKIMEEEGLERNRDFKVWIMVEVPSVVLLADEFAKLVDGFSIGSNDLTQLTLGVDRDSGMLYKMGYFDERDPAVLKAMGLIIDAAHRNNITVSICGQAPSVYPEIVEFLVRKGVDSVSVNPDAVIATRRLVASVERKIVLEKVRDLSS